MSPRAPRAYLICGTPRTGSTLLCGLLRASGVAGLPESYFRDPDQEMWAARWGLRSSAGTPSNYRDFVRAAVSAGSTPNGVLGARVMWGTIDRLVSGLAAGGQERDRSDLDVLRAALGPTRFVHLWREDTVAQAVSWVRAEQTGYWQQGDTVPVGRRPVFDATAIADTVRTIQEHNAAWRGWFRRNEIRPHGVRYEDLVRDLAGVTRGVLDFLGLELPPGTTPAASQQRQADSVNDEWIARYQALTSTARGG